MPRRNPWGLGEAVAEEEGVVRGADLGTQSRRLDSRALYSSLFPFLPLF